MSHVSDFIGSLLSYAGATTPNVKSASYARPPVKRLSSCPIIEDRDDLPCTSPRSHRLKRSSLTELCMEKEVAHTEPHYRGVVSSLRMFSRSSAVAQPWDPSRFPRVYVRHFIDRVSIIMIVKDVKVPVDFRSEMTHCGRLEGTVAQAISQKLTSRRVQCLRDVKKGLVKENASLTAIMNALDGCADPMSLSDLVKVNLDLCRCVEETASHLADILFQQQQQQQLTARSSFSSSDAKDDNGSRDRVSSSIVRFRATKLNRLHKDSSRIIRAFPPRGLVTISKPLANGKLKEETVFEIHKKDFIACSIVPRLRHCLMLKFDHGGTKKRHQYRFECNEELHQFYVYVRNYME